MLGESYIGNVQFTVTAYDAAGNSAAKSVNAKIADATPPAFPDFAGAAEINDSGSGSLSWSPAVDNSGSIASYQVRIYDSNNNLIKTLTAKTNSVNVSRMISGDYYFEVTAFDANKNSIVSPRTEFTVESIVPPSPSGNGIVQVYSNGTPILTTSSPLSNYVLSGSPHQMQVFSGGNTVANTIIGGAVATINDGGNMYDTQISSGGIVNMLGGNSWNTTVNANGAAVVGNGVATRNQVNGAGAVMEVNSRGIASETNVQNGGLLILKNGGQLVSGQVSDTALLYVSKGGYAKNVNIASSGTIVFDPGAKGSGIDLQNGAAAYISQGVNISGLNLVGNGAKMQIWINSDTMVQLTSSGVSYQISNGYLADFVAVGNMYLEILSGGRVSNYTNIAAADPSGPIWGGALELSSGGVGYNVKNHNYGQVNVFSGAYLSSANTDTEGEIYIYGGSADNIEVNSKGYLWVHSGGRVENVTVNPNGGMIISSGANAAQVKISGGGVMVEESNANLSGADVYSGGILEICGAKGNNITVHSGGLLTFSSSFYPMDVDVPVMALSGTASNVTVSSGGALVVRYTGIASQVKACSGAEIQVSSASVVRNLEMYDGAVVYISSDGLVSDLSMTGPLCRGAVFAGGTINGLTMSNMLATQLMVSSGACLKGSMQFTNAAVYAVNGALVEFSLADRTPDDSYLINDLSSIAGDPSFSITVKSGQAAGVYKLAQGAADFTDSISLYVNSTFVGTLSADAAPSLIYGGYTYTLMKENSDLSISVIAGSSDSAPSDSFDGAEEVGIEESLAHTAFFHDAESALLESFRCLSDSGAEKDDMGTPLDFSSEGYFPVFADQLLKDQLSIPEATETNYADSELTGHKLDNAMSSGLIHG
jgi:hypothetical protein